MNELEQYVADLKKADPKDDALFANLIARGCSLLNLSDIDLARELGASRPTITRWRNGSNAPHFPSRRPIYALLEKRAKAAMKRSGTRPSVVPAAAACATSPDEAQAVQTPRRIAVG